MDKKSTRKSGFHEHESRHQCLIYNGAPSQQLPAIAAIMQRKLEEDYRCVYLNSRPMVAGLRSSLAARGIDVVHEIDKGSLVLSSDPTTSPEGDFNIDSMLSQIDDAVVLALRDGFRGLWATGDMTWEFGPEKNFAKLVEYELRLEKLFHEQPALCGVCQYHCDSLPRQAARQALFTHRGLFINDTLSRLNPHYSPSHLSADSASSSPELDAMISALCRSSAVKA